MRKLNPLLTLGVYLAISLAAASPDDYKEEAKEPVKHVFTTGANTLDVDNVNGSLTVIGDGGNTIRLEGEKVIRARDKQQLDRGRKEVTLDLNQKDGVAQVYVNGPFRNGGRDAADNHGFHEHNDREYHVTYNLTVRVPRSSALRLRGVNGSIKSEETSGSLDVRTVNGSITLTNVAGSGKVETVNGSTVASFRENPKTDTSFKSVNGKIEVTFQPNLAANLQVKTFNGAAYTDFETTLAASPAGTAERKDGRFQYRGNQFRNMKVGSGGPEIKFETLNGGIQIHKSK